MSGFIFGLKASRLFSVVEKFQIGSSDWLRLALSGHPDEFVKFFVLLLDKVFFLLYFIVVKNYGFTCFRWG